MGAPVTVLLPVRNGGAFIDTAIRSVLAQRFSALRLLVSDNGSSDDTVERVRAYTDPRVELVRQAGGLGMLAHFNRCLDMVDSEYYMLLCHDDYFCDPTALQKAHAALEAHPAISAVYCDLSYVDKVGRPITRRRFRRSGVVAADRLARDAVIAGRNLFGIPVLVRTRAVASIRYDERLPYAADLDLSIAMSRHGEVYHIAEALIANRFHGKNASVGLMGQTLRQMEEMARKHRLDLGRAERLRLRFNSLSAAVQKWVFFQYLGKVRRYSP